MKRYLTLLFVCLTVLCTGCVTEDWNLCDEDENCWLRFRYPDENGIDVFSRHIHSVDLLIFDENRQYLHTVRAGKDALDDYQGIFLYLEPGVYNIVCWGNLREDPVNKNLTYLEDGLVEIEDENGGLPLFYAPFITPISKSGSRSDEEMDFYRIVVPKKGIVERDIEFVRAYRTIEVYIKGYIDSETDDPEIQVEIDHLAYAYDFLLRVSPLRKSHLSIAQPYDTPEGILPGIKVNTPYQEIENEITIYATTTTGREVTPRINLKTYLEREGLDLEAFSLHEIKVLITLEGGEVNITLPAWNDNEVKPEF